MYPENISIQSIVVMLRSVLYLYPRSTRGWRKVALTISELEKRLWVSEYFREAESEAGNGLIFTGKTVIMGEDAIRALNILDAVIQLYIVKLTPVGELYQTDDAAAYLGITKHQIYAYMKSSGFIQLKGARIGNTLVFTRQELDIHQQTRMARGRPVVQLTE